MEENTYKILETVNSPADIKGMSIEELKVLCAEIRQYMRLLQNRAVVPQNMTIKDKL